MLPQPKPKSLLGAVRKGCPVVLVFAMLYTLFFGNSDPDFFFNIMKTNNFRGDLTDILANKQPLVSRQTGAGRTGYQCFEKSITSVRDTLMR